MSMETCPYCQGSGLAGRHECPYCGGYGHLRRPGDTAVALEKPAPRHGQERNGHRETMSSGHQTMVDSATGKTVYDGPVCWSSQYVCERYCATCGTWQEVRGIMGVLLGCPQCKTSW